jgi:hypothetical protein
VTAVVALTVVDIVHTGVDQQHSASDAMALG